MRASFKNYGIKTILSKLRQFENLKKLLFFLILSKLPHHQQSQGFHW